MCCLWVRMVDLSIQMWNIEILRRIGEACGGLLGMEIAVMIQVLTREWSYRVQLWWEIPLRREKRVTKSWWGSERKGGG